MNKRPASPGRKRLTFFFFLERGSLSGRYWQTSHLCHLIWDVLPAFTSFRSIIYRPHISTRLITPPWARPFPFFWFHLPGRPRLRSTQFTDNTDLRVNLLPPQTSRTSELFETVIMLPRTLGRGGHKCVKCEETTSFSFLFSFLYVFVCCLRSLLFIFCLIAFFFWLLLMYVHCLCFFWKSQPKVQLLCKCWLFWKNDKESYQKKINKCEKVFDLMSKTLLRCTL